MEATRGTEHVRPRLDSHDLPGVHLYYHPPKIQERERETKPISRGHDHEEERVAFSMFNYKFYPTVPTFWGQHRLEERTKCPQFPTRKLGGPSFLSLSVLQIASCRRGCINRVAPALQESASCPSS